MKIEAKQLVLGEKIAKIAILGGLFLWFLQATFTTSAFTIVTFIFAMITVAAFIIKMFWDKYGSILNMIVIFGGLLYLFFVALGIVIVAVGAGSLTFLILSILLIAGLVYETVVKKNLDAYKKFIDGFMVFVYGFSTLFTFPGIGRFGLGLVAILVIGLGVILYCAVTYFNMKGTASSE